MLLSCTVATLFTCTIQKTELLEWINYKDKEKNVAKFFIFLAMIFSYL